MQALERSMLGLRTAKIMHEANTAVVIPEAQADEFIPNQNYLELKQFLAYVAPSSRVDTPLSFAQHLKKIVGRTSGRSFSEGVGVDHSTLSRLLNSTRAPELATVARIIEGADLSDEHACQVIADSVTVSVPSNTCRLVFSDNAPALEGSISEQVIGYRLARGLSQRTLAEKTNVDHASISRLESRGALFTFANFARLVSALGLNARQIRGALRAVIDL